VSQGRFGPDDGRSFNDLMRRVENLERLISGQGEQQIRPGAIRAWEHYENDTKIAVANGETLVSLNVAVPAGGVLLVGAHFWHEFTSFPPDKVTMEYWFESATIGTGYFSSTSPASNDGGLLTNRDDSQTVADSQSGYASTMFAANAGAHTINLVAYFGSSSGTPEPTVWVHKIFAIWWPGTYVLTGA